MKKNWATALLSGMLLLATAAVAGEPQSKLSYVAVGAGATGGNFYMTTATFCQTFNEKVNGTTCNAETTSGSTENNKMLIDGDLQMGICNIDSAYCAAQGTREYAKDGYDKGAKIVVVLPSTWSNLMNIVVRVDSGITNISQLKGKVIACNSGSQMTDYTPMLMKVYGIEDYTIRAVTTSEMADAMRDRHVDAIVQFGAAPTAIFADLASTTPVRWLSIDAEHMKKISDGYPYFAATVLKSGTYPGQNEDVAVLGNMPVIAALDNLDEGFVYQFVKCMIENHDEIVKAYAGCKNYSLETLIDFYKHGSLPLHSGTIQYLKDIGAIK
jgi:TRAP transporter TAXI family solute receptor